MDDLEFLNGVRSLLSAPEKWCQGRVAKDAEKLPIGWGDDKAVCWCLAGAGHRVAEGQATADPTALLSQLLDLPEVPSTIPGFYGYRKVVLFNDALETTFDMVAQKLDEAIIREKAKLERVAAPSE